MALAATTKERTNFDLHNEMIKKAEDRSDFKEAVLREVLKGLLREVMGLDWGLDL